MRNLITLLLLMLAGSAMLAQRTTRPQLRQRPDAEALVAIGDTIYDVADEIVISGYEKTLRSRKESFLTSNNGAADIIGMHVTLNYFDMEGRQLHQRALDISWPEGCLPAGETRMTEFKSWDSQFVWFYHLSMPTRTKMQATPYDIKISIDYYIVAKEADS